MQAGRQAGYSLLSFVSFFFFFFYYYCYLLLGVRGGRGLEREGSARGGIAFAGCARARGVNVCLARFCVMSSGLEGRVTAQSQRGFSRAHIDMTPSFALSSYRLSDLLAMLPSGGRGKRIRLLRRSSDKRRARPRQGNRPLCQSQTLVKSVWSQSSVLRHRACFDSMGRRDPLDEAG